MKRRVVVKEWSGESERLGEGTWIMKSAIGRSSMPAWPLASRAILSPLRSPSCSKASRESPMSLLLPVTWNEVRPMPRSYEGERSEPSSLMLIARIGCSCLLETWRYSSPGQVHREVEME